MLSPLVGKPRWRLRAGLLVLLTLGGLLSLLGRRGLLALHRRGSQGNAGFLVEAVGRLLLLRGSIAWRVAMTARGLERLG